MSKSKSVQQLSIMKRFLILTITAIALIAGTAGCDVLGVSQTTSSTYPPAPKNNDIRPALPGSYEKVMSLKKPKLIFFSTSYDATSPDVKKRVKKVQKEYGSKIAVVNVNAESDNWTSALVDHKIRYFPTVVILDQNNQEAKRFEGYVDQDSLMKVINDLL